MKTTIRLMLATLLLAATAAPLFADGGGPAPKPIGGNGGKGNDGKLKPAQIELSVR